MAIERSGNTKLTSRRKKGRGKGLGDTDQPVVVVQNRKSMRDVGVDLFKKSANDSFLKTVTVYVGGAIGAYYGLKLLGNVIGGDIKEAQEKKAQSKIITEASNNTNPASAAAVALARAIYPAWDANNPKAQPFTWATVIPDEVAIFNLLAGPTSRTFYGGLSVASYAPKVNSLQSWQSCANAYQMLTGRNLEDDLRTKIGSWDWDTLKGYIAKTRCMSRKVDPKTGKVTLVKIC